MRFDSSGSWREIHDARLFASHPAPDGEQFTTDTMRFVMR
jgi:hypothetical protein